MRKESQSGCICFPNHKSDFPLIHQAGVNRTQEAIPHFKHAHSAYELIYLQKGERTIGLEEDGAYIYLTGGQFVFLKEGLVHGNNNSFTEPNESMWVLYDLLNPKSSEKSSLSQSQLKKMAQLVNGMTGKSFRANKNFELYYNNFRDALHSYWSNSSKHFRELCLTKLKSLLVILLIESIEIAKDQLNTPNNRVIEKVIRFMKEHLHENISLEQLAKFMELNPRTFHKLFKNEVGLTPMDYFQRLRCREARKVLENSGMSLKELTYRLGFSSQAYFTKVFKKYTGRTPNDYRKKLIE